MMRMMFRGLANMCLTGFLFLLPVFVAFQVVSRAWTALGSLAARLARFAGARDLFGVYSETAFTGLLLVLLCILFGWLVRFSLVSAFHDFLDKQLARYIPGYEGYKAAAEAKVHRPVKVLPYASALIHYAGFWRPAYVIERDGTGNSVVFLPNTPNTEQGHVLLATDEQIHRVPAVSANQMDATLKNLGRGLLSVHQVVPLEPARPDGRS